MLTKQANTKKIAIAITIAIFFVTLDRFLKIFAFKKQEAINMFGDILQFNFAKNPNIAFSIPFSGIFLNITITLILFFLLYHLFFNIKKNKPLYNSCLIFLILGTISNLFDRIKHGYVIDYIDLKYFTVFNIADSMIVCSVLCLMIITIKDEKN